MIIPDEPQAGGLIDKYFFGKVILILSAFALFIYLIGLILK